MKSNWKINKNIQQICRFALLLVLAIVSIAAISPSDIQKKSASQIAIANYRVAQQSPDLTDEEKIKTAIDAYFTTRYESQKLLQQEDFSPVLEDSTLAWVTKEKDKREVQLYIASLFDLKYQSYNFTLDYDSIEITDKKAVVQLRESHEVVFDALAPDISKMGDLKHTLTLHNKNGAWVIYQDEYKDEYSELLDRESKEKAKEQVYQTYLDNLKSKASRLAPKVYARLFLRPSTLTNYGYNSTAARNYADAYWNTTNPPYYIGLGGSGGDCTNFVSQAMYAGEGKTPPDTSGMNTPGTYTYDWYYIWNNSGSLPWIRVQDQYVRITANSYGRIGPYGTATTNRCLVRLGDIVQLYNAHNDGIWDHEGIIVESPYPLSCDISLFKVDAHTTNYYHYSLANWAAFQMRYILIQGWQGN